MKAILMDYPHYLRKSVGPSLAKVLRGRWARAMAVTEIERYAKELEKQMPQTGKRMIVRHLVFREGPVMDKRCAPFAISNHDCLTDYNDKGILANIWEVSFTCKGGCNVYPACPVKCF